jgi:hypothetical protein
MNQYMEYVTQVQKSLVERKACLSSRNSHKRCYSEFEQDMESIYQTLTHETIHKWLREVVEQKEKRQRFDIYWTYMEQLEEFIQTGAIIQGRLPYYLQNLLMINFLITEKNRWMSILLKGKKITRKDYSRLLYIPSHRNHCRGLIEPPSRKLSQAQNDPLFCLTTVTLNKIYFVQR